MNRLSTFWEKQLSPSLSLRSFFSGDHFRFLESGEGYRLAECDPTQLGTATERWLTFWDNDTSDKTSDEASMGINETSDETSAKTSNNAKQATDQSNATVTTAEKNAKRSEINAKRKNASKLHFWVDEKTLCWFAPEALHTGGCSLLTLLCGGDFPPIGSGVLPNVLAELCRRVGISESLVPEWNADEEREFIRAQRASGIVEAYLWIAHRLLTVPDAAPVRTAKEFLLTQGIPTNAVRALGLGYHANHDIFRDGLSRCGYTDEEIEASELISSSLLIGRVVGPIRDERGRLLSLWACHPDRAFVQRDSRVPEFLFKGNWRESLGFFAIPTAIAAMRTPHSEPLPHRFRELGMVVVCSSLLQTLRMQAHRFGHSIAAAGAIDEQSVAAWNKVVDGGFRRALYLTTPDDESESRLWGVLENVLQIPAPGLELSFLTLVRYRKLFEPSVNEYTRHGRGESTSLAIENELAESLLNESVPCCVWAARTILARFRPAEGDWTRETRAAAWREAVSFYRNFEQGRVDLLERDFVPIIVAELGVAWETGESLVGAEEDDPSQIPVEPEPTPEPIHEPQPEPEVIEPPTPEPILTQSAPDDGAVMIELPPPPEPEPTPPPVMEPEPVVVEPIQPESPEPVRQIPRRREWCDKHQCEITDCFCFD